MVAVVVASLGGFVALCLAVFGAPLTAGAVAAGAGALCLRGRRLRRGVLAVWLVVAVVGIRVPLHEYADRLEDWRAALDRGGPAALSTRDRLGIWVLNLGMAIGGAAVGLPEVALETTLLAVPSDGERHFRSCFAERSPRVRAVMERHRAALPAAPTEGQVIRFTPERVAWRYDVRDARVALALNPTHVGGTATFVDGRWELDHTMSVPVDYPADSVVPLFAFDGRRLVLDEAPYNALEELGWLFPYHAVWHCSETLSRADGSPTLTRVR
jgi:hypothetical protein